MAIDITWPLIISTALVDSINPCAIGVLILLISTLIAVSHSKKKMLRIGAIYITAVYITYFLAGIGLLLFIQKLNIAEPLGIFVGILVIILGLIEIKDFFWYGRGIFLGIPQSKIKTIKEYARKASGPASIFLGIFVAAVELPCTGGPYLAITTWIAQTKTLFSTAVWYLLVYNFIFVLPLIIIVLLAYFGMKIKKIEKWRKAERRYMRLMIGLILVALGILLILFATGTINFASY